MLEPGVAPIKDHRPPWNELFYRKLLIGNDAFDHIANRHYADEFLVYMISRTGVPGDVRPFKTIFLA